MPTQFTLISNGLGGVGNSYASIQDLDFLSLPRGGKPAIIDSSRILTGPFNLTGLTLKFQVTEDGLANVPQTFTFPANYTTLDQVVNAISIPLLVAKNNSGRFSLQTIKYGYDQGIYLDKTGTANSILGLDDLLDTDERGITTLTKEFSDDDKTYALVMASSEADGYLQRRYCLPIQGWDYALIRAVCDIAAFTLVFREGYSPDGNNYDKNFKIRYDNAIKWLSDVGNRKIHPLIKAGHDPIPVAGSSVIGRVLSDPRRWSFAMGIGPFGGCCGY